MKRALYTANNELFFIVITFWKANNINKKYLWNMKENLRRTLLPIFDYSNLPVSFPSENKYHMLNTSYFNIYLQGVRNKQ